MPLTRSLSISRVSLSIYDTTGISRRGLAYCFPYIWKIARSCENTSTLFTVETYPPLFGRYMHIRMQPCGRAEIFEITREFRQRLTCTFGNFMNKEANNVWTNMVIFTAPQITLQEIPRWVWRIYGVLVKVEESQAFWKKTEIRFRYSWGYRPRLSRSQCYYAEILYRQIPGILSMTCE